MVIQRHKLYPPFDGHRLQRFDEQYPATPFQRDESPLVVCVERDPVERGLLPILCRQSISLWLKNGVRMVACWSALGREPELHVIMEGCYVTVAPNQIDSAAITIESSPSACASAPPAMTTEGKMIATANLGHFRIYDGEARVRDLDGRPSATMCSGDAHRIFEDLARAPRRARHRMWVYAKVVTHAPTRQVREGGVVLADTAPWWALLDIVTAAMRELGPLLDPSTFDRHLPLSFVMEDLVDRTGFQRMGDFVEKHVLPALVPSRLRESDVVRLDRALRKRLGEV
jgi:hypothetical protein